jgi:sister-chromatid-cohesion protein PDS5
LKLSFVIQRNLLERIDDKHPRHEFLKILSVKCSYTLFGREHMRALVKQLEEYNKLGDEKLLRASMGLLVVCVSYLQLLTSPFTRT